jgi:hypothetical protein
MVPLYYYESMYVYVEDISVLYDYYTIPYYYTTFVTYSVFNDIYYPSYYTVVLNYYEPVPYIINMYYNVPIDYYTVI